LVQHGIWCGAGLYHVLVLGFTLRIRAKAMGKHGNEWAARTSKP